MGVANDLERLGEENQRLMSRRRRSLAPKESSDMERLVTRLGLGGVACGWNKVEALHLYSGEANTAPTFQENLRIS